LGFVLLKTRIGGMQQNDLSTFQKTFKERIDHRAIEDPFFLPLAIVYTHCIILIHIPE
jgi:hypothetical protein